MVMPSIRSKVFTGIADMVVRSLPGDFDFDVPRMRRYIARMDKLFSSPRDVDVEPLALRHCDAQWVRPRNDTDRYVLYFPGGGWVLRTPRGHRRIAAKLAKAANAQVLLVFYRLAPEHPYPAAMDDCLEAYQFLLDRGIDAERIIVGGDSAGGNLTLGSLLALRDRGYPCPAGGFALSPATDISLSADALSVGKVKGDAFLPQSAEGSGGDPRLMYAGGDKDILDLPYVSPLRGDLHHLCPLLLQAGSKEMLLGHATAFAEKARAAGVDAEVEIWDGQPHAFQGFPFPESELGFEHLGDFIRRCCP
jgi:acetyl esterase/lipase